MKTPEEWLEIWKKDGDGDATPSETCEYELRFIATIQDNAIRGTIDAVLDAVRDRLEIVLNKLNKP